MTTKEIEKDVIQESAEEYIINCGDTYFTKTTIKNAFIAGAAYANSNWQEKTRWIPIEERLPEVRKTPFFIAVTAHDGSDKFRANIKTFLIRDESDIRWMVMNCKYWKEIE